MHSDQHASDLSGPAIPGLDAGRPTDGFVRVRGARENNLRNVDVDVPRDAIVAFTGVSGSGKSSLAFGTIYAEAQRRYFESVAPYARRLIQQGHNPKVEMITGLPPAVALQQRRGDAQFPLHGRHGHHALQLAADALLPRRGYPEAPASSIRTRSRPTPPPGRARSATAWASCTPSPSRRWSPTPR